MRGVADLVFLARDVVREEKFRRWNILLHPQKRRRRYCVDIVGMQQLLPGLLEVCGL